MIASTKKFWLLLDSGVLFFAFNYKALESINNNIQQGKTEDLLVFAIDSNA